VPDVVAPKVEPKTIGIYDALDEQQARAKRIRNEKVDKPE
jgi:hypothetical protein